MKKTIALILVLLTMAFASGTASAKAFGAGILIESAFVADGSGRLLPAQASLHKIK